MIIGCAREIKDHEARVGLVPWGVTALRDAGHRVLVEAGAGVGSSIPDREYSEAGAEVIETAGGVWKRADLGGKVKGAQPSEYAHFPPGVVLFSYLHPAPPPELTRETVATKVTGAAQQ